MARSILQPRGRGGTGRRPHAPHERLRLHRTQRLRGAGGAALIRYGRSEPRGLVAGLVTGPELRPWS
jgi:hypothetical protein